MSGNLRNKTTTTSSPIPRPRRKGFAPLFKHGVRTILSLAHSFRVARAFVSGAGENRDRNCGETRKDGLGGLSTSDYSAIMPNQETRRHVKFNDVQQELSKNTSKKHEKHSRGDMAVGRTIHSSQVHYTILVS